MWRQEEARQAGPDSEDAVLLLHGALRHPGDLAPPPATSTGVVYDWYTELLPDPSDAVAPPSILPTDGIRGHLFMDGSRRRHTVRELSRAGWAVVMVSQAGERLGVFKGPLWAPWPQTSQGYGFGALAWTGLYSEGPSDCYSDCRNVVNLMNLGEADAISGK
eukprot:6803360-Pyramimonas_sp.AAC.1